LAQASTTLNTLLAAESELTVVQLTTTGAAPPGIQFYWNRRANQGVLAAYRLPPAAEGKVYQLWLIHDGTPVPSTTFNSSADGRALVASFSLPANARFEAVAVTVEPAGGSRTPTLPILLVGTVAKASD
jgi:anti-sigma-K factor RskA